MKAIIYAGAVIGCHQTATPADGQIVTEGQAYAALDLLQVTILDTDCDVTGYAYVDGELLPPADVLAPAQQAQMVVLTEAYQQAFSQDIDFTTAAGVTAQFQADVGSIADLQSMLTAYGSSGVLPDGFFWVAADNRKIPVTFADLQALAKTIGDQGWAAFRHLQDRKADVRAAKTIAAAQAVTW